MESKEITSAIENDQSLADPGNGRAEIADNRLSIVSLSADLSSEATSLRSLGVVGSAKGEAPAKVGRHSAIGHGHDHRRQGMGRKTLSKEVIYAFLFSIAVGAVLVWRLFTGA